MKKILYKLINRFGYNIYNKKRKDFKYYERFRRFKVSENLDLLLFSHLFVNSLLDKFPDLQILDWINGLEVKFSGLTFYVESREELLILCEIFVQEDYAFFSKEPCAVIDIGANVGMASIYFSQFDFVKEIYLFEPVKDTFDLAVKNIQSNSPNKVKQFNNFGLGAEERKEEFLFSREVKGNCGIRGKLSPSYKEREKVDVREVKIVKASQIVSKIISERGNKRIIIKMDCEGSEYEIISNLKENDLLGKIDVIMLEWHDFGPEELVDTLKEHNFTVFSRNLNSIAGMIHAVRS